MEVNTTYSTEYFFDIEQDFAGDSHAKEKNPGYCREAACVIPVVFYVIIFVLGITGNAAVIWITGFKMKKSVISTWYLSLAVSDFIFCSTLPFNIDYMLKPSWNFGLSMCKFNTFVEYLSVYSRIFILVIISVDRCVSVQFPVWAQNQRTVKNASIVVVLTWIVSSSLSIQPAKCREILNIGSTDICYIDFEHHKPLVLVLFTFGFLIPFLIIFTCYFILIHKLRADQTFIFTKPYKIMTLLITAFYICWLPYQIVSISELDTSKYSFALFIAHLVCGILASAHSFLNPFIYVLMDKGSNEKWYSFLSKIESAIDEETQSALEQTLMNYYENNSFSVAFLPEMLT